MLVAAYARVSTDRQDREQTIDSQVDALRRAAEQRGWHLAADLICRDDGRTGTTLARPGLDRLRDLVAEGTCAAVLVCSPDRLARNFAHQVLVIDEFKASRLRGHVPQPCLRRQPRAARILKKRRRSARLWIGALWMRSGR